MNNEAAKKQFTFCLIHCSCGNDDIQIVDALGKLAFRQTTGINRVALRICHDRLATSRLVLAIAYMGCK